MKNRCISSLLFCLAIVSTFAIYTPAFAIGAHTEADEFDQAPQIERDSGATYDLQSSNGNLHIKFSVDPEDANAVAQTGHTDTTINGIRVYFDNLTVEADVSGSCDTMKLVTLHKLFFGDLKLYQGDHLIGPSTGDPPVDDTYSFDGGEAVFNHVVSDDHSIEVTGLTLRFVGGESHTWSHAYASLSCTTPVELQAFSVD